MNLLPRSRYTVVLKEDLLGHDFFHPQAQRCFCFLLHATLAGFGGWGALHFASWAARAASSLLLGHSIGCLAFVGHEMLHGSILRNKTLIKLIGGICFCPWGLPPGAWARWHNQIHHNHTNDPFQDPDCWGKEINFRHSKIARFIEGFSPGSGKPRSVLFLFVFFTFKVYFVLFLLPQFFPSTSEKWISRGYFVSIQALCVSGASLAGWQGLLFLYFLPMATANFLIMSYIITNHSLNRLTEDENDCLANSLTVRSPSAVEWLHMNFNFHTEHHLFPSMSPRFAPRVRNMILARWKDRYNEMAHWRALARIYATPRFYKDDSTLINPRNGEIARTIN